jgi:uncharacterized protein
MRHLPGGFFSGGYLLDADLYLPDPETYSPPYPAIIGCSGYQGLKTIHPERFARGLVPTGNACLAFDYRGFGASEGERGRLVPQEQVEDVISAVSFLQSMPEIDSSRIGLAGWALGGGVAVAAAAEDDRVGAVAAVNAVGDGWRTTRCLHTEESWSRLITAIADDRLERVRRGRSKLVPPFEVLPLDDVTGRYVDAELYKAPGFGSQVTLEAADYLLRFHPDRLAARISPRPVLLVHGADNGLYGVEEARAIYEQARDPKQIVVIEGAGHTEWMFDDHPTYQRLVGLLQAFFESALKAQRPASRT